MTAHAGMTGDRRLPRQTIKSAAKINPGGSPEKAGSKFTAGKIFNQELVELCAENDEITFFAIFDPAEYFAAQKRLERNGHMHVRPSPRIPYIGRRTTRCARVSVTFLL